MQVTLPDGAVKEFDHQINGFDLAASISKSLLKQAVAIEANGTLQDMSDTITDKASVKIITKTDAIGVDIMRHTLTAQVLARAVKNLYPSAKLAIGPTIDEGFYYDIAFETPISTDDLETIEKEMKRIIGSAAKIEKKLYSKTEALNLFKQRDEKYKQIIIDEAEQTDNFQIYHQEGTDFIDLCRGPHLPSLSQIGAFKLLKVAGAYWKGKSDNEVLTRIYGTAWSNEKELKAYLFRLEEQKKRDHRKLGKEMNLFTFAPEEVGVGLPIWLGNGTIIREALEGWAKQVEDEHGYERVMTPVLGKSTLYETSGHLPYYKEDMYAPIKIEDEEYYLRPMNCPHHHHVYKSQPRSYRDLPVRVAEFGFNYRYESSGSLTGLMRTRGFCVNDAHIYCRHDQVEEEFIKVLEMYRFYYSALGISEYEMRLSKPDDDKLDKYVDNPEKWVITQNILRSAMDKIGFPYTESAGDAAFYGPKIDCQIKSAIGTEYTISTNQLDFLTTERFDLTYTGEDGQQHPVYVIHRAPLGSSERFIAYLIEHYGGHFPLWLSPVQIVVTGIVSDHDDHVEKVVKRLKSAGMRAKADYRNEKINYKIREHMAAKVTMVAVIGDKERDEDTITIRRLGSKDQKTYKMEDFIKQCQEEIATKALPPHFGQDQEK